MKFKIKVEMELELQGGMVFEIKEGDRKGKYLLTFEGEDEYRWIDLNEYCEWAPLQNIKETADDITTFNMIYIGLLDDLMK